MNTDDARHGFIIIGPQFYPDTMVMLHAQQIVDHLETRVFRRVINPAEINQLGTEAVLVIAQEADDTKDIPRGDDQRQLALLNR